MYAHGEDLNEMAESTNTEALLSIFAADSKDGEYALGGDSLPQEGVPTGTVIRRTWNASRIYPDAEHEYWVYIPAQYTDAEPACVMAFQDGQGYVSGEGGMRAATVFDNLIHKGEMPVTIGVFVNPGRKKEFYDQRGLQYTPLNDTYARFLLEEILPEVGKEYRLVDHAAGRAICGMSDGGLCAFTVAWERPDAFSKAVSHVGSYTRLRGGSEYPFLIRKTRGNPKPIRVFLQDGTNDLNITEGNWMLANMSMASALMFARYDYHFEMGIGGHDLRHGGAIFPDTLRWLWRDYPGVKGAGAPADLAAVLGKWDMVTNANGDAYNNVLTITAKGDGLAATLADDTGDAVAITSIAFADGILQYEYPATPTQRKWGKGGIEKMATWLKVRGETLEGALSAVGGIQFDYSITAQRRRA